MSVIDSINDQILILDLCNEFGIETEQINSGNFTHRCKCPSPDHKSGKERTPSLHIDSDNNNFYCYGCGAYSSPINFYMLAKPELDLQDCIEILRKRVKVGKKVFRKVRPDNFDLQREMSDLIRYYNKKNPSRREELLLVQKKLDVSLEKIGYNDVTGATKILGSLRSFLKKRFS